MRLDGTWVAPGLAAFMLLIDSTAASAQMGIPYVAGHIGSSAGDGGAALAGGATVGYITPRRLGFELEISAAPDLDFGDLGLAGNIPALPVRVPLPTIEARGRLLTFQTNATAALPASSRIRAYVGAGGGIANLQQDILYRLPILVPPVNPDFTNGPVLIQPVFNTIEQRVSRTENALCLNVGGAVDYVLGSRLALGFDARYTHAFFDRESVHTARFGVRLRWQF
jgi:opacity protein-like surface antigen